MLIKFQMAVFIRKLFTTEIIASSLVAGVRSIASAGMDTDSDPFGSGRPSLGLKYFRIDIV